jgi:hypothetical protein
MWLARVQSWLKIWIIWIYILDFDPSLAPGRDPLIRITAEFGSA